MKKTSSASAQDSLRGFAERSQALHMVKSLLRLIRAEGLTPGRQLPSQRELRRIFGVSNHSISAAMAVLADAGIVERRVEAGTFLRGTDLVLPRVWSCGLAFWPFADGDMPFYSYLFHAIQRRLLEKGVRPRLYSYTGVPAPAAMRTEDFPGLAEDIADGLVDAVICPGSFSTVDIERMREAQAPYVHSGAWEQAPTGVIIDQLPLGEESAGWLAAQGCRRLAAVSLGVPEVGQERFWEGFVRGAAAAGLPAAAVSRLDSGGGLSAEAGRQVGRELLARPRAKRPDGLLIVNDWLAQGMCEVLFAAEQPPLVAVQINQQTPVRLPDQVLRFAVDINRMAERTVEACLQAMLNPAAVPPAEWLRPERLATE